MVRSIELAHYLKLSRHDAVIVGGTEDANVAMDADFSSDRGSGRGIRIRRNCGGGSGDRQNPVLHLLDSVHRFTDERSYSEGMKATGYWRADILTSTSSSLKSLIL